MNINTPENQRTAATIGGAAVVAAIVATIASPGAPDPVAQSRADRERVERIVERVKQLRELDDHAADDAIAQAVVTASPCAQKNGAFKSRRELVLDACEVRTTERPAARFECEIGDTSSLIVRRVPGTDVVMLTDCALNIPNVELDGPNGGPREREERLKKQRANKL